MSGDFYESSRALSEYLLFHYGTREQTLPCPFGPVDALDFPVRCVAECLDTSRLPPAPAALDLGCAVGRSSFELARHCAQVVGVDFSHSFIAAAKHLRAHGSLGHLCAEEGDLARPVLAKIPSGVPRERVSFERGDAHCLRQDLGPFDVVLMANLVDRLREPKRCLDQLPRLVRPGGQLILTSPYTWLEDFTPRQNWLGGFETNGQRVTTLDALKAILAPSFDLAGTRDLPLLMREHARKYQWSVAQASLWIRK